MWGSTTVIPVIRVDLRVVTFKVDPLLLEKIDEYARKRRLSRSEVLRDAIQLLLATEGILEALELENDDQHVCCDSIIETKKHVQCPFCHAKLPSLRSFRFHVRIHLASGDGCPVCGASVKNLVYHAENRLLKSGLPLEQRIKYAAIVFGIKKNGRRTELRRNARKLAVALILKHCIV